MGVLSRTEYIEIAQPNGVQSIATGEHVGVELVHIFGDSIGREGTPNYRFHFWQIGMIAVGGAGSSIDEALHVRIARCNQYIEEPGNIAFVGADGVLNGTRHGTQRCLVQNEIHALACGCASFESADVALYKAEITPGLFPNQVPYLLEIMVITG